MMSIDINNVEDNVKGRLKPLAFTGDGSYTFCHDVRFGDRFAPVLEVLETFWKKQILFSRTWRFGKMVGFLPKCLKRHLNFCIFKISI